MKSATWLDYALGLSVLALAVGAALWFVWRTVRRSGDPAEMVIKWLITAGILIGSVVFLRSITADGSPVGKIAAVLAGAVLGLCVAIVWVPVIAGKVGDWFAGLYTGGNEPPPPQPFYSIAQARRKQGRPREAIYEIQQQLERFPTDVTGQMLLAEIQADDLKDLAAAQITIDRLCAQPGHAPRNVAFALNSLADWRLKLEQDHEGASAALQRIVDLLPDTEEAQVAHQRIAHLADPAAAAAARERKPIALRPGVDNIGLLESSSALLKPEDDPAEVAQRLVKQLESHPFDAEARERLARIYSDHYQRLDLAAIELEQLIAAPGQPPKEVARWLNLLADWQVRHGTDYETVRGVLQRIVDGFPGFSQAELAQQRIERLRLEIKGREKGQVVKLGTYEQNLGLRQSSKDPSPGA